MFILIYRAIIFLGITERVELLVVKLYMLRKTCQPKIILIGPQGPVLPIVVKSVYWGLGHIERPIRIKFNI